MSVVAFAKPQAAKRRRKQARDTIVPLPVRQPPSGTRGFVPGTPTFSATPLAWTHAQFIRLAWDARAGRVLEQPAVVARRYGGTPGPGR